VSLVTWVAQNGIVHAHRFMPLPGTPLEGTGLRPPLPETAHLLGKLAFTGKLTGSWNDPKGKVF